MEDLFKIDRYQMLIESTTDWMWEVDGHGKYTYSSPQIQKILGYTPHEIIGLTPFDLMPRDEAGVIAQKFAAIATKREAIKSLRNYNLHKEGHLVLLETSGAPFYDAYGDYAGYRGIDREVVHVAGGFERQIANQEIINTIDEAVIIVSPDGDIELANPAFCALMGYDLHQLLGQNISLIDTEDGEDGHRAKYALDSLKKESAIKHKRWRKKKSGALVHVNIRAKPICNEDGEVTQIVGIYSELKKVEELKDLLRESNYSYHKLHSSLLETQRIGKIGSWTLDLETQAPTWSEQLFHMFGMSPLDKVPSDEKLKSLLAEESYERLIAAIQNTIKTGDSYELELKILRMDSTEGWMLARGAAVVDSSGEIKSIRGIAIDISGRKALEVQQERLSIENKLALETAKLGVWHYSLKTGVLEWNERQLEIYGLSAEEFSNNLDYWKTRVHPDDFERAERELSKAMSGEAVYDVRFRILPEGKELRHIDASGVSIRNEQGVVEELIGINRDITPLVEHERQLTAKSNELMDALMSTVEMASEISNIRDPYTSGHERRVAEICVGIAGKMGCDENVILGLKVAATLHDIGKMGLPAEILTKPGKLTAMEYEYVKTHSQLGYNILKFVTFPWPIADIVLQHHERMDGSGYPNGLKGDEISLEARIMGVADVVEAMASHRPYRAGLGINTALDEIERGRGNIYDEEIADACLSLFRDDGFMFPD